MWGFNRYVLYMKAIQILDKYHLRKTRHRLVVLEFFLKQKDSVSQGDLQEQLADCDRVTIYRILHSFEKKGIIHRISDTKNAARYVFSEPEEEVHQHLHFKCDDCGKISCLSDITPEKLPVPDGYKIRDVNFLVLGTCRKCNEN